MAEEIRQLVVLVEAKVDRLEKAMAKASSNTTKRFGEMTTASGRFTKTIEGDMARASNRISTLFSSFGKGLALGAAGAVGVAAVSEIPGVVRSIVAEGAGLVDVAAKIGMTTDSLQELHFAATQGGASIEDMDKSLGIFAKGLGEASQGSGELLKVLDANGIALRDQAGNIRPAIELLRQYADLIRNAGSEQERARITAIAFGRAGDDLANVFREGAAGIDQTAAAASRLGLIIDDDLLQQIADIDDQWDAFATTLETRTKSGVLAAVSWLDELGGQIQAIGAQLSAFEQQRAGLALSPGAMIGSMAGTPGDPLSGPKAGASAVLAAQLRQNKPTTWVGRDDFLGIVKPTILPPVETTGGGGGRARRSRGSGGGGSGGGGADRAKREQSAIDDLIKSLEDERREIGMTDTQRAVSSNLRQAGADATEAQKEKITALTKALEGQRAAQEGVDQVRDSLKSAASGALSGLVQDLRSGTDAATAMSNAIDGIIDQLLDMAINKLVEQAFGGLTGGGGLGSIVSLVSGAPAAGALYASGGEIRGPGTGTSDSIPIWASDGEFMVRASAAAKHRDLLRAINSGRPMTAFAAGGLVGSAPAGAPGALARAKSNDPTQTISISAPITIHGSSGSPEQNADLAGKMSAQLDATVRGIFADEARKSRRPGNPAFNRGR